MICYTLKVVEIYYEANDAVTICFKQPALKKIKYQAGQYLTLIFRINGRRYLRPYSFSSAPGIDQYLEITVKRVSGGIVSNHIYDKIAVGDVIEVIEPMGDFILDHESTAGKNQIVLWAAGSGITPLFSITKYALKNLDAKVTLVYGNRNFDSTIFLNQIEQLLEIYPDRFSVWHFHTQLMVTDAHPNVIQGRIQPDKALFVAQNSNVSVNTLHYICGPIGLKESVREVLKTLNVSENCIFSEDFEIVKDEKQLVDIITRSVTIIKDEQTQIVEVVKGKSILEAGLDALLEISYSCQTGNCSLCKGKLINGQVKQVVRKHPDLSENEYQLCCTYPITNDVKIII